MSGGRQPQCGGRLVGIVTVVAVCDVDDNDTESVSLVSLRFGDAVVAVTVVAVGWLWLQYRWLQLVGWLQYRCLQ
jgi:hypothetical protein